MRALASLMCPCSILELPDVKCGLGLLLGPFLLRVVFSGYTALRFSPLLMIKTKLDFNISIFQLDLEADLFI